MKNFKSAILSTFLLFVILQSSNAQKDVSDEIMKAYENFTALFEAGDVDKFLTVYTNDAICYPGNSPAVSGKDGMKELWSGMMGAGITPVLHTTSAEAYGKTAIEVGTADILAGGEVVDKLEYMVVWKKVKGDWKLHRDMWHSVNPAAGGH